MKKYPLLFLLMTGLLTVFIFSFSSFRKNSGSKRFVYNTDSIPLFASLAKAHLGKSIMSQQGVVSFTTGLHNDYYMVDSQNKKGYLYIETRLGNFINDNVKRVPLNLCLVIDRSGSMQGVKMGQAKKAAKGIIERLKTEDKISIVMYDGSVDSVLGPVYVLDKKAIQQKIEDISPRGSTNLWGGTEKGYDFVGRAYEPGFVNRVLLISDGLANQGITDPRIIRNKVQQFKDDSGITLSTFGVGLDYNESLMTDMAETGMGNYYFIDAPDQMASIFEKELNGLMNVAAQNAELRVTIPHGIRITKSYPMKYTQVGNELVFKMRDLFSEETKGTVISFDIADGTNSPLQFVSKLSFTDVTDGQMKTLQNENLLQPIQSIEPYLTHFNQPVIEQVILAVTNENLEKAMEAADRGDYEDSKMYVDKNETMIRANYFYRNSSSELRMMDSVNRGYYTGLQRARALGTDSVKVMQKKSKEVNYQLRQKKQ